MDETINQDPPLSKAQLYQVGRVYDIVAQLTPLPGRDFMVYITFPDGGLQPAVRFTAVSDMGRAWLPFCVAAMSELSPAVPKPAQRQQIL